MIERKSGAILNVASTAAFQPGPGHGGLFRDQGLCPVLHRGAARGAEAARRSASARCAPARPGPSSARSPASAATACSTASRWSRRASSRRARRASTRTARWSSPASRTRSARHARASPRGRWSGRSPARSNTRPVAAITATCYTRRHDRDRASRASQTQLLSLIGRPLGLPQFALASAIVGPRRDTYYCQVYCLIAFQPLHPMTMPLSASFAWAIGAVMPWLACLELAKRRYHWAHSPLGRSIAILGLFGARRCAVDHSRARPGPAGRRPFNAPDADADRGAASGAALTAGLLWLGPRIDFGPAASPLPGEPVAEILAMAATIDWIEAAGNYVEVHAGAERHPASRNHARARAKPGPGSLPPNPPVSDRQPGRGRWPSLDARDTGGPAGRRNGAQDWNAVQRQPRLAARLPHPDVRRHFVTSFVIRTLERCRRQAAAFR